MGRTLNYTIKKASEKKFTDSELENIISVREKYTSGKLANAWSCEYFYPNPINFYTNFHGKRRSDINLIMKFILKDGDGYDFCALMEEKISDLMLGKEITIGKFYKHKPTKKMSRAEAAKFLHKEEWIVISDINTTDKKVSGFVKVQGNEFNAMLTFLALKEISTLIPTAIIDLSDEGDFLLCPIKICNGKALPVLSDLIDDIRHYSMKMLFSPDFKGNILEQLNYKEKDFCHEFSMGIGINNSYGDMTRYINEKLRNIKEVQDRILPLIPADNYGGHNQLYFENLETRNSKDWFDADLFTRIDKVNPKDFVTYKMSAKTLMDSGEQYYGFNLDEDAESKSYHNIGFMQKLFAGLGTMEVLGEK